MAGVTFPLELLSAAVAARAETWAHLEMRWHTRPLNPNHEKAVVTVEIESSAWVAEVMIWGTGEGELATFRLADDRVVNKHYEFASHSELEDLLDEFLGLLVHDTVPAAAVVVRSPATPA